MCLSNSKGETTPIPTAQYIDGSSSKPQAFVLLSWTSSTPLMPLRRLELFDCTFTSAKVRFLTATAR
jgi:hypothetical protein